VTSNGSEGEPDLPLGRAGQIRASTSLDVLSEEECWSVLQQHNLGRLAIVVVGWPRVFPVNYAAGEGALVFRTEPGAKLAHGPGSAVCFEIDGFDERTASGWSVMAVGILEDLTGNDEPRAQRLRDLPLQPVAPGKRSFWLALTPDEVSGRRFRGGWVVPGQYLG
jgi:nitroimidazol reductase NimA-like FMN-containing flavoprotein (pyridoxamine 5'-phosphate oxidase superfamily)